MKVSERSSVKLSALAEDLFVEDRAVIYCTGEGSNLKVEGDIRCEGTVEFVGSVSCVNFRGDDCKVTSGSLTSQSLVIRDGSLEVHGDLSSKSIDIDKRLTVSGRTDSNDIEVGGILEVSTVRARSIEVGGKFRASSDVEAEDIDVGGLVEILGKIKSRTMDVGGKVRLNGGEISGRIEVGGVFETTGELNFGDIDVGGVIILGGASRGGTVEVGGKLEVRGDIGFRKLDVGGWASVAGKAEGESIDLGGRLRIDSYLKLTDELEVGGTAEVGGDAEARIVSIGGSFRSRTLKIESANFRGHVKTQGGIYASGRVEVEKRSRVEGWIRSLDSVVVNSKAEIDYVSAPRVSLGDRTRARGVYAENLVIDEGAEVLEEALYTESISGHPSGEGWRWQGVEPRKVDSIPEGKRWTAARASS